MQKFSNRLSEIAAGTSQADFSDLIDDQALVVPVKGIEVDLPAAFSSRLECGRYFSDLFNETRVQLRNANIDPYTHVGLWSWLSASMGTFLLGKSARPVVGERARWVYMPNDFGRYYRHLLAGPFRLYDEYRDDPSLVSILLYNEVVKPNTAYVEQIVSRPLLLQNREAMKLVHDLYFDVSKGKPKKALKKTEITPGDIRRFGVVFNQLALIWDLSGLSRDEILEVLPKEFKRVEPSVA